MLAGDNVSGRDDARRTARPPQRRAPRRHRTRVPPARRAQPHVTTRHHSSTLARRPHLRAGAGAARVRSARREGPRRRAAHAMGVAVRPHGAADARRRRAPSADASPCPNRRRRRRTGRARDSSSTPRSCSTCTAPCRARAAASRACCSRSRPSCKSEDVHEVVGRIQQKAQQILVKELNIDAKATMGFAMTLSEVVPEHRGARRTRRLGGGADVHAGRSDSAAAWSSSPCATRASDSVSRSRARQGRAHERPLGRRRRRSKKP